MKPKYIKIYCFVVTVLWVVLSAVIWHEHRIAEGYRELALTVSTVKSVTIYDIECPRSFNTETLSNKLSSGLSAPFPLEVFTSAVGNAEYHNQHGLWKGALLVVLTFRDGSQRRMRISYFGGGFAMEGVPGLYVVKGGEDSNFFRTFQSIKDQFIAKRK